MERTISNELLEAIWEVVRDEIEKSGSKKKIFPLDEIKSGYLIRVRENGRHEFNMTVFEAKQFMEKRSNLAVVCKEERHFWYLVEFDKDLISRGAKEMEIVEVWGQTLPAFGLDNEREGRKLLWKRD